jgi:PAS domain S-box-containing protein
MRNQAVVLGVLIGFGCALFSTASAVGGDGLVLTNIGQIRALSPPEIARKPLVRLDAVVTHYNPSLFYLWVQDEFDGVSLLFQNRNFNVEPGDRVRVTGWAVPFENSALVQLDELEVLGKGTLPEPLARTAQQLNTFAEENRRVEAEGRVLDVTESGRRWHLEVESGNSRFWLEVPKQTNENLLSLMGATVRGCGVCTKQAFKWGEKVQPVLLLRGLSDIVVLQPGRTSPPFDPYRIAAQPVSSLTRQQATAKGNVLVHVQGIVLDQRLGEHIVIRDDTGTLFAETHSMVPVKVKERVDLWGTPVWDGSRLYLKDGTFRPLDSERPALEEIGTTPAPNKPAELPLLTQARQIRDLSPRQAAWKYPVRLHGVVTLYLPLRMKFFVQDDTAGVYVRVDRNQPSLKSGDLVEIEGVSNPGGFAPIVVPTNITILGTAPLPEPLRATLFQLATGQYDSQWIEAQGVVRSQFFESGLLQLRLSDPSGTFDVHIPATTEPTNLLDAVVRVCGVCASRFSDKRQLTGVAMWSPALDYMQIEEPGVADPLSLPTEPILSLSQFQPRGTLQRRVKIAGVVTLCQPGQSFFVQDADEAIQVFTSQKDELKPGDQVLVAGYPALGSFSSALRDAVLRVQSHGLPPTPKLLTPGHALDGSLDNAWVQMDARLLSHGTVGHLQVLTLQLAGWVFEAQCLMPAEDAKLPPAGSLLRLTGVYRVLADEARSPSSFQLLVPSFQNVHVLEQPTWWTSGRLMAAVGVVAFIAAAATLRVALLRHRVREQTRRLREQTEREAVLETHYRDMFEGAQDMIFTHDLEGRFTSLNPTAYQVLGYTAKEAKHLAIDQVLTPESTKAALQIRETKLAAGKIGTCELEFVAKDGRHVLAEVSERLISKDGKPVCVQGIARDVTERKQAAEALQRSHEEFKDLFDNAPIGFHEVDAEGRVVRINKTELKMLGYSAEELLGQFVWKLAANEELSRRAALAKLAGEPPPPPFERVFRRKDGSVFPVLIEDRLVKRADGTVASIRAAVHDITALKEAEAALSEASSLLEMLLANSPDVIYFKDKQSRFVRFSKAFEKLFRVADAEVLRGKTDFDFFTEEHARAAFEDEQEIIRTGKPIIGKMEKETHPDGRVTWCLTTKLPWRDKDGNTIGTFGTSKDVTSIKEAEDKLAHEQELLRTLLDNLPDSIYFKDQQSRFVRFSKAFEKLFNVPDVEQLRGKTDFDFFTEEHARPAYEDEQEIIRTGKPIVGKMEKETHPDGRVTWCLTTKMPWRDKDGNIIGTFGISKDVTALKEAETELAAVNQRLVETSRLAGMAEVATDVLHNVGNVLNSVNVSCTLMVDRVKESSLSGLSKVSALLEKNRARLAEFLTTDPQGREIPPYLAALAEYHTDEQSTLLGELEQLRENVDHIKQIVAMQQSYAKVAGVTETVNAPQLVDDALQINAAALNRHKIEVRRQYGESTPILTERHKALQILVNLIRNAKYALDEANRPDRSLLVKVGNDESGQVKIQITDNGVGIPPENITRIFAHGFTTRRNGHGFGLHSSALAAKELGGTLQAHSDGLGKGATFTLLLPPKPPTATT